MPRKTAEDPQPESDILIEAARADRRSDLYRFGNSASARTSRLVSDSVIAVDFTAIFGNFY